MKYFLFIIIFNFLFIPTQPAQKPGFKVIAFFTGKNDLAHITFVQEANQWFPCQAEKYHFSYDTTTNWNNLNAPFLAGYNLVLFLDTRPEDPAQRQAFEHYMKNGGAWMGFHFAAFALNQSAVPQNWNWYQNEFLGSGEYVSNTWRPTPAVLRRQSQHPVTGNLPDTFRSQPNEWYRWKNDLRRNRDIKILLSIDTTSFPLGTGPKPNEIWHSGFYPVVWTNKNYRMVYVNMGHNDMDYEGGSNATLSHTFGNPAQDELLINALLWLGKNNRIRTY